MGNFISFTRSPSRTEFEPILEPFNYIASLPSKEIRTQVAGEFNCWLNAPKEETELIIDIVRILHNASLILDDIEDGSEKRRMMPAAHVRFGVPLALNAAHYAAALSLEKISKFGKLRAEAGRIFSEQILEMTRGQGMEIYWREKGICPTETEYETIIIKKTEGLFALMARLLQLYGTSKADFRRLVHLLSFNYQVRDDYENIMSEQYASQKGWFEDVAEGKFSFPIIHALSSSNCSAADATTLRRLLKTKTKAKAEKRKAFDILLKYISINYTKSKLKRLKRLIQLEMKRHGLEKVFNETFLKVPPPVVRVKKKK